MKTTQTTKQTPNQTSNQTTNNNSNQPINQKLSQFTHQTLTQPLLQPHHQSANELIKELNTLKNPKKAKVLQRFFKTGVGEYGEGDIFLGITVPILKSVSKKYYLELSELQKLLDSKIHEHRLIALFILIKKYENAKKEKNKKVQKEIYEFYLKNLKKSNINNWDLIDLSTPNILGDYLIEHDKSAKILYTLSKSKLLWERRAAILGTFSFIKQKRTTHTLKISKILLNDEEDLIQKAVGWMLREMGKRASEKQLCEFLDKNYKKMPRTMLRYAIEKLNEKQKKHYMKK
ncbi:MAG: DNA alkylation repair protein [Candidatus Diapherotrites archaeon]|uniref:DNA alkylation repair protein n=1 Tax=Candidatus Iainarchaeum sp. TaxID=3101447 RepID=A0A7K4BYI8_9ARCH|nr:DNA alkylation repair protein [Candidatus Diapherotrites archaeon]